MANRLNAKVSSARARRLCAGLTTAGLLAVAAACGAGAQGGSGDTIKVGSILDETGPLNIYGVPMADATELAIKDINANGGVLGRQLELVTYDTQSDNAKYTQYASRAVLQDRVAVLVGGITSASREAVRPVMDRSDTPYLYNVQYEGGVCDANIFINGTVPSQQLAALIPHAIAKYGPRVYVAAADYNFGHVSAEWVNHYVEEAGGEVVDTEFIPLESSEFGSVINDLQATKPDFVLSVLAGGNHMAFYRQFNSAGLDKSIGIASTTFGNGNEQVVLSKEAKGITVAFAYFQELKSSANKEFLEMWHTEFGRDYPYVTDGAASTWNAWHLWADAVNAAGSTDKEEVTKELEANGVFTGPGGAVQVDGGTHHLIQDITIGEGDGAGGFKVLETEKAVPPSFEQSKCDLISDPQSNEIFTP